MFGALQIKQNLQFFICQMICHIVEFVYLFSTVRVFSVRKRLHQGNDENAYCHV